MLCNAPPEVILKNQNQTSSFFAWLKWPETQPLHICVGKAWGLKDNPSPDPAQCGKPTALGTPFFLSDQKPTYSEWSTDCRM